MNMLPNNRLAFTLIAMTSIALWIASVFAVFGLATLIGGDIVQAIAVLGYLLACLGVVFYLELGD